MDGEAEEARRWQGRKKGMGEKGRLKISMSRTAQQG